MKTMEDIIRKIEELEEEMLQMEFVNRAKQNECMDCMHKALESGDEEKYNDAFVGSNKACVLANQFETSRRTLEHMVEALNYANNR